MTRFTQRFHPRFRAVLRAATLGLLWAAACGKPEPESDVEIVGGVPPCTGCRIELGPPLELRSETGSDPALHTPPNWVTIDGLGRYWVAEGGQLARIYDANGKFLRTAGRKGGGANDFDSPIAFLPLPGDSMLVFDHITGTQALNNDQSTRALVVDSLYRVVRALHIPGALLPTTADGWPSRLLLTGPVVEDSAKGLTLHAVSAEQANVKILQSFGPGRNSTANNQTMANYQRVTTARDSTYWCADILRYRISHFAKDGTLLGTIERAPDWFPIPSGDNMGKPDIPPPPKIFAIWQAADGMLWVFGQVAGKNWKDGWPKLANDAKEVDFSALRNDKLYATVIEVLDPITRQVVSTAPLDEYISNVLPNGNVAVFAVDSAGTRHLSIRRLSLTR
ncbi:MAG: hypothetical protein ABJB74_19015 [Gemmatimonas sp.]